MKRNVLPDALSRRRRRGERGHLPEQPVDGPRALRRVEPAPQAARHLRSHLADLRQLLLGRLPQRTEGSEVAGQHLGQVLPHVRDPQRVQESGKGDAPAPVDRPDQVVRRLLPEPLHRGQRLPVEPVQVGRLRHKPLVHEGGDDFRPHPLDVHRVLRGEMTKRFPALRHALPPGAAVSRLAGDPLDGGVAHRAPVRDAELRTPPGRAARRGKGLHHLRDHVPRPLHEDPVAHPDVLRVDQVLVVQRGAPHGDAAHHDGGQEGDRGDRPRPSDADDDLLHGGLRPVRGELRRDGPPGGARDLAQLPLERGVVRPSPRCRRSRTGATPSPLSISR